MGAIVEAIDQELGAVNGELEVVRGREQELDGYRQRLEAAKAELNGQETLLEPIGKTVLDRAREEARDKSRRARSRPTPGAPKGTKVRSSRKPPPSRESEPVASQSEATRSGAAAAATARSERVVAFVREHPGCTQTEIREHFDIPKGTIGGVMLRLVRTGGALRTEEGEPGPHGGRPQRLYYAREHDMAPSDTDGAKTAPERRIVDALGSIRLTAAEIKKSTGIDQLHLGSMLMALVRRGVLVRENEDGVPLYGVAKA